jgi:hypothetical protein
MYQRRHGSQLLRATEVLFQFLKPVQYLWREDYLKTQD